MTNFNELLKGPIPVLVDFYADWCGPCRVLAPILKNVKSELGDNIRIVKVDVDKNQAAASHYGIKGIPTLILFQNGQQLWRQSGVISKEQLLEMVRMKTT